MEFRILGPLEVVDDGRQIDLGGAKQRALLTMLLLEANRVVSSDRLIDGLWDERPPEQARKALQVYVSQLRKALGKQRIETQSPGYLIRVGADELDLDRVRELAVAGDLAHALALFRGRPLAEFETQGFASTEAARLDELRLTLLENRIEADLARGRHASLVGELEALVREHPLRESLRAQLMLALYRSGRQAESLDAFQDARRALVDELGIEPSRELRELHQAILRQAADLDLASDETPIPVGPPTIAETASSEPAEPGSRPRSERKTVTVLHVRIDVAATDGDRLDPEVLMSVTSELHAEISAAIQAHEGTIVAVAGDAVTGVFGMPLVHEDDPTRALRAAEDIQDRLAASRPAASTTSVDLRIGVSTGIVVVENRPDGQLRATGEPLTASSRLAQEAERGKPAIDDATRRATQIVRRDNISRSPMVGRQRERRRLQATFEQSVEDRSCQLFTIIGAAGVGKSRLVQEFLGEVSANALVGRGRCLPYGEGITYWPVLEAVRDVAELQASESADETLSKLARLIEDEDDAELVVTGLGGMFGLPDEVRGAEESFLAVRTFFEALARRRPLVVVFDDIHWAEPTFLDLLDHVSDWTRDAPILLVCVARPELLDLRPQWGGGKLNATIVSLEPLSEAESGELLDNLLGATELETSTRRNIADAAAGNPLFVEEMLALVLDLGSAPEAFEVPPTIQALLAARLDRLSPGERSAIEAASVEGQHFHEGSVVSLVGEAPAQVHSDLMTLLRKDLVRPLRALFSGEPAFGFRHILIRDAAYNTIPKDARARLHESYAMWLEATAKERALEFEEILGYHLEQAFHYRQELGALDDATELVGRRAAELLGSAGRRAFARIDAPAALNLISRAIALVPAGDPLQVDLIPSVRAMQGIEVDWAQSILENAMAVGEPRLQAHAAVQQGFLRLFFEELVVAPEELIAVANDAIALFSDVGDDLGLARAWRLVAQSHYLAGRAAASADAAATALGFARRSSDRFEQLEILEWLGIALLMSPMPATEGEAICRRLLADAAVDPRLELTIIGALAYMVGIQGRAEEAAALIAKGRSIAADYDATWLFPVLIAFYSAWLSTAADAERDLRPVYEGLKGIGEKSHFCSISTMLAQAVYAQGRYDEAEQLSYEAERSARPNDVHSHIVWRGTRAKVLARRGEFAAGERLAREAVEFGARGDFAFSHADALGDLAEVLRLAGRSSEAARYLEEALRLHEGKGNVLAVEQTRARLAEVA